MPILETSNETEGEPTAPYSKVEPRNNLVTLDLRAEWKWIIH